ncbi:MAG: response regulator [Planctomycetia bacterium]|nr:MAG: response regulator [Planctomycetia bacterium]
MSSETVGRSMEILLVEDNLIDARLTIEALKEGQVKHRLTLVRDGIEALAFLRREGPFVRAPRPDLILLDLRLPGMDGREVLTIIKADDVLQRIPLVVLTGSEAQEDVLRAEELHVDGYLVKPMDMQKFITLVRRLKRFWHEDVILPAGE